MCVIIINHGKEVSFDSFEKMYQRNPDGIGIMFHDMLKDSIQAVKQLVSEEELYDFWRYTYLPIINNKHYRDVVIHFRYATDGDVNLENVHPYSFEVNGVMAYAMHNGIMPNQYRGYSLSDDYITSDTHNFVSLYLNNSNFNFGNLLSKKEISLVEEEIGASKLVVLADGSEGLEVFNRKYFRKMPDGNLYSNLNWQTGTYFPIVGYNYQLDFK